ncbi:hypothetical protein CANTEDRAFT_108700 [Yamadazyma tenuis ATCC 10573]|uniref:P-loop containing nucleoside triphosphate hydrolase protein n=2 Tax=Candida tenuis TaxID=2315449 RepID=G3B8B9_CANTC|nr:uncharacterized protein CANTEDRAFT_108700 [Yamadazyma tenuis ATCC 10573]EGV61734.1 hypothetical protein CANTEDRAFT_108700 [Yamadazyma tenuis ATCC 10573]
MQSSEDQPDLRLQKRLMTPFLSKKVPPIPSPEDRLPFQEANANFIQRILFTWLHPIMKVGYKRTLVPDDMYCMTDDLKVEVLAQSFYDHLEMRTQKAQAKYTTEMKQKHPQWDGDMCEFKISRFDTIYALFLTFKKRYVISCCSLGIAQLAQTLNPLIVKKLIKYVELKNMGIETGLGKGVGYSIGVTVMILLNGVALNQAFYRAMSVGALVKAVLTKALLEKSFRLNAVSKHRYPVGKITSIMGTDLSRIDFALGLQPFLVVFPIPMIVAIVILCVNIGPVALVGVAIMLVFVVFMGYSTKMVFARRKLATVYTDSRVNYLKECLNNLRIIKYYSWEPPYMDNVSGVRKKEMGIIYYIQVVRNVVTAIAMNLSLVCSMITFLILYAVDGTNDAANIFSSLAVFNVLTQVLFLMPMALAAGSDALVGINRVGAFLSSPENTESDISIKPSPEAEKYMKQNRLSIKVDHASFEWEVFGEADDDDQKKPVTKEKPQTPVSSISLDSLSDGTLNEKTSFPGLNNIDIEVKKGEFLVITGLIGSGKSSLLNAMAGFMKRIEGTVSINGSLMLCGQPWIQNTTVKDNIIFGHELDEKKYADVIYACSLERDLSILPAGDRTEIGERGITLSGGQKARINLARAIYANREIILFDDVLSAVDARVGRHIMEKCILGMLSEKTRILATHQLSLIGSASRIIFLNGDGSISIGTPDELAASNEGYRKLMAFNNATETEIEEEDEEVKVEEKINIERQVSRITAATTVSEGEQEEDHKVYNTDKAADGRLVLSENKSVNGIGFWVVKRYFQNGSGPLPPLFMLFLLILFTGLASFCSVFTNTWLSFWTEKKFDISEGAYIGVYVCLALCSFVMYMVEFVLIVYITNTSATNLNIKAVQKVLYSPMSFLDTTPMGRILNRFTKDTDVLDNEIGQQARFLVFTSGNIVGVFVLCICFMPWFALSIPPLAFAVCCIGSVYRATCREVKRLESVQRSFIYNNFNESLNGMDTIKAYGAEERFLESNAFYLNKTNEPYLVNIAAQRWLTVYLSIVAACFNLVIALLCVTGTFGISASASGLLLSSTLQITGMLSMLLRNFTQVENGMNSVERLCDFAYDLNTEAAYRIAETKPAPEWPQKGEILFDNVSMAYRPGLPMVLKNLDFNVKSQEKIGICGRTGAGKSSIMTALYRLSELEKGKIIIDGVDISNIGLNDLRSKLSIIPQDPVLFKGSIRRNLDPFGQSTSEKMWNALRRAGLIEENKLEMVKKQDKNSADLHKFHLDQVVEDDGVNFSLGERQLIAFARALVRGSKILILDEATSSVDYETDSKIQQTIAREFSNCTILCIAHRLKTIINYDKILVLDRGEVKEFDTPWNLFNIKGGIFKQMCEKSSIVSEDFQKI